MANRPADASDLAAAMRCRHDHLEDQTPAELRESAYRRGYHQGLYAALRMLQEGASVFDLEDYLDVVYDWRTREGAFQGSRSKVQRPPVPVFLDSPR